MFSTHRLSFLIALLVVLSGAALNAYDGKSIEVSQNSGAEDVPQSGNQETGAQNQSNNEGEMVINLTAEELAPFNANLCSKEADDSEESCRKKTKFIITRYAKAKEPDFKKAYYATLVTNYTYLRELSMVQAMNIQLQNLADCPHSYDIRGIVHLYDKGSRILLIRGTVQSGYEKAPGNVFDGTDYDLGIYGASALKPGQRYAYSGACYFKGKEQALESGKILKLYSVALSKEVISGRKAIAKLRKEATEYERLLNEASAGFDKVK